MAAKGQCREGQLPVYGTISASNFRVQSETCCQSNVHHIADADMKSCGGTRLVRVVLRFLHTYFPYFLPDWKWAGSLKKVVQRLDLSWSTHHTHVSVAIAS